jgi:hypothetical protein
VPTFLRLGALRVVIYPKDHRPVHVIGQGHEAVFELNRPVDGVTLRENYASPQRSLAAIERGLTRNLAALLRTWERMHEIA